MAEKFRVVQLNSKNYQRWQFDLEQVLGAKELWEVVSGKENCPLDPNIKPEDAAADWVQPAPRDASKDDAIKKWKKKDFQAKAVIAGSLDDEHHSFIRACVSSRDMWEKLKSIHQSSVDWDVDQLSSEYNALKFDPGTRVNAYFSELGIILQRLEFAGETISERLVLAKVLKDLPTEYASLKQSWRLLVKQSGGKMTLGELQAQLNALEKESEAGLQEEASSMKALKTGHTRDKKTNPGKWKNKQDKKQGKRPFTGNCFTCGKEGHMSRDCSQKKNPERDRSTQEKSKSAFVGRRKDTQDWHAMSSNVIRESRGKHLRMCGDSGASFHVTSKKHLLLDYEELDKPVGLEIGDGRCIQVTGKGWMDVEVFDGRSWEPATLTTVMYCQALGDTDLFSLSCTAKNYRVVIEEDLLMIQEKGGGKIKITGYREEDDLFALLIRLPGKSIEVCSGF